MEYEPHSTAARKFEAILTKHLILMNDDDLDEKLTPIDTAHFRTIDRIKRADASFPPRRLGPSGVQLCWMALFFGTQILNLHRPLGVKTCLHCWVVVQLYTYIGKSVEYNR